MEQYLMPILQSTTSTEQVCFYHLGQLNCGKANFLKWQDLHLLCQVAMEAEIGVEYACQYG